MGTDGKVARRTRAPYAPLHAPCTAGSMRCIGTHLVLRRDRVGADVRVPVGRQLADHRCEQEGRTSGQLTQLHLASTRGGAALLAGALQGCARTGEDEANAREHGLPAVHELRLAHVLQVAAQLRDGGGDAQRVEAHVAHHGAVKRGRLLQEGDGS